MTFTETKEFAVASIRQVFAAAGISVKRIILFGSQARGNAGPESDWDFLVCVDKELSFHQRAVISSKVQWELAKKNVSIDLIIRSEAKVQQERGDVGLITYYALKDGVSV
jgi:predicted nucleotidyltransferase